MITDSISKFIKENSKFILTTHETPDGDGIGSEYALYHGLIRMGKTVRIINNDSISDHFSFISSESGVFETLESVIDLPEDIEDYVLFLIDTNDINNIGAVSDVVLPRVKDYFIIDHHESGEDIATGHLITKTASSTSEMMFEILKDLEIEIDMPMAQALFTGIVFDTGSFIYPKTSAKTFLVAHYLVSLGVSPNYVYSKIYESNSIASLRLHSKVVSNIELFYNEQVALQSMLKDTLIECGAEYEEADQIINIPLKSKKIEVSIFFKENLEGILRCSLRSKGKVNVARIAQTFGGGGHKTAAGFKCRESYAACRTKVLDMVRLALE
ncbi:MAG: DHH family phosphoesterase [Spirochaetia bacterium]